MAFVLKIRRIDIHTGDDARVVVLRGHDAASFGINPGDRLEVRYRRRRVNVVADVTHHSIRHGEIGLFEEVWKMLKARNGDPLSIEVISRPASVAAIKKKLLGQPITREDMWSIIGDIVSHKLSPIETTYFVASGYVKPYDISELIWMVEAMAKTGETFHWGRRLVVDKHSVGGLAGNRTTMVAIPIVAALGLTIPKTSSRAITSPAGTADTMEVLAPVTFAAHDIRRIVKATNSCLIWGGGLSIAPADDLIIRLSRPLSLEPYDKMIVSILAKKVAMGIKVLIVDMPYGPDTKIPNRRVARDIEKKFLAVGRAFNLRVRVRFDQARQPIGQGIGPALEARDVVRVLQQKPNRPIDLERKALALSAELMAMARGRSIDWALDQAKHALRTGLAWRKMQAIITAQGGRPDIDAEALMDHAATYTITANRTGRVTGLNNRAIDEVARTLGAPEQKLGGLYLERKLGQTVKRGQPLLTLYSHSADRIQLARAAVEQHRPVTISPV